MSLHEFLQRDPDCRALAEGAVHAVAPLLEDPDPAPLLSLLDHWAFQLAGRMPLPWSFHAALDALNHFLFVEEGFQGDRIHFDEPANAVLPQVLTRRRGLPVSLGILWIELARRLGFQAVGIGLPGHFLTGIRHDLGLLYFDPFDGGRALAEEGAGRILHRASGGTLHLEAEHLQPIPDRAILVRLVRNLHQRYLKALAWDEVLWTSTHLILLAPSIGSHHRDRALAHLQRGNPDAALEGLRSALPLCPDSREELERLIQRLEADKLGPWT